MKLVHLLDEYGYNVQVNPDAVSYTKAYTTVIEVYIIGKQYPLRISGNYGEILHALYPGFNPEEEGDSNHVVEEHEKPDIRRARQDAERAAERVEDRDDPPPPPHRFSFGRTK